MPKQQFNEKLTDSELMLLNAEQCKIVHLPLQLKKY